MKEQILDHSRHQQHRVEHPRGVPELHLEHYQVGVSGRYAVTQGNLFPYLAHCLPRQWIHKNEI